MELQNPVFSVKLDDLCIEAVLDSGFLGAFSFSDAFHSHAYYELIVAVGGKIRIEHSRMSALCLEAGCGYLIPPGVYHRILSDEENAGKLAVRFHCAREGQGSLYGPFSQALESCREPLALGAQGQLYHTLRQLQQELSAEAPAKELYLQSLLNQSFLLLLRQLCSRQIRPAAASAEADSSRRLQLEDYLYQHFDASVTEEDLARHMHLSKRQVSRVLQQIYGKSFRQLLIEIRLQHAAQLLTETKLPVEQIAVQAGYTSLSGFYDAFRKAYGMTAGQYRKNSEKMP